MNRQTLFMVAAMSMLLVGCGVLSDWVGLSPSVDNGSDAGPANSMEENWLLVSMNSNPVLPGSRVELAIDGNQASGHAGCNHFSATVTVNGDSLRFGLITRTEMACVDADIMQQETGFLTALEAINTFTINNVGQLVLEDSGAQVRLLFEVVNDTN